LLMFDISVKWPSVTSELCELSPVKYQEINKMGHMLIQGY